eukprot:gb/GECG01007275.1/.p1 GENE.gb/GECG01007275.1/~~gb/GECG01007275.1/.p1  ORF type:complete len:836 (+),score=89.12 gb/GECG01007275.1/:1-2508(+)
MKAYALVLFLGLTWTLRVQALRDGRTDITGARAQIMRSIKRKIHHMGGGCIHDDILEHHPPSRKEIQAPQEYSQRLARNRHLAGATLESLQEEFSHIRISYDLEDDLSGSKRTFFREKLIPDVVGFLERLLQVRPVNDPLFAYRECTTRVSGEPSKCEEYEQEVTCADVVEGDTITIPDSYLGEQTEYDKDGNIVNTLPGGNGVNASDFHVFIRARDISFCGEGVVGFALTCQRDQFDRPIFGAVYLCPNSLSTADHDYPKTRATGIHEMLHALGFTASSLSKFRDINSLEPLTPRDSISPDEVSSEFKITYDCDGQTREFDLPSKNTTQFVSSRGISQCETTEDFLRKERCVARMVTSKAAAHGREYFNCSTLEGPDLENQPTRSCQILGSHWDERILATEIMSPIITNFPVLTDITLGFLEDSGWYLPNYTLSDALEKDIDFGFHQGCAFVNEKCLVNAGKRVLQGKHEMRGLEDLSAETEATDGIQPRYLETAQVVSNFPSHFCAESDTSPEEFYSCTVDRRSFGTCNLGTFEESLPTTFQYFPGNSTLGGGRKEADYCPMIVPPSAGSCLDPEMDQDVLSVSSRGQRKGISNSVCLSSTIHFQSGDLVLGGAGCYEVQCLPSHLQVVVYLDDENTEDPVYFPCFSEGEVITSHNFYGSIVCPDPSLFCDTVPSPSPTVSPTQSVTGTPSGSARVTPSTTFSAASTPSKKAKASAKESPSRGAGDTESGGSKNSDQKLFGVSLSILIPAIIAVAVVFLVGYTLKRKFCKVYVTDADLYISDEDADDDGVGITLEEDDNEDLRDASRETGSIAVEDDSGNVRETSGDTSVREP